MMINRQTIVCRSQSVLRYEDRTILIPLRRTRVREMPEISRYSMQQGVYRICGRGCNNPAYVRTSTRRQSAIQAPTVTYDIVDTGFYDQKMIQRFCLQRMNLPKTDSKMKYIDCVRGYNCTKIFKRKFLENCHLSSGKNMC